MLRFIKRDVSKMSTSSHAFNADLPMRLIEKVNYFAANFFSNVQTKFKLSQLQVVKFQPSQKAVADHFKSLGGLVSPSRIICNIFWEQLDWGLVRSQLGGEIRVIEVGCGTGRYGTKLRKIAQIDSYKGIDIQGSEQWYANALENFEFEVGSYENFLSLASGENLILTQSAIEHFERDIHFFDLIKKYAESREHPVISIHLFPSPACLFTMLLHGIRQYNRRSIAKLVRSSGESQCGNLYALGGIRSNFVHFIELTLRSLILRKPLATKDLKPYLLKVTTALTRDSKSPSKFSPSFYALILSWKTGGGNKAWVKGSKSNP